MNFSNTKQSKQFLWGKISTHSHFRLPYKNRRLSLQLKFHAHMNTLFLSGLYFVRGDEINLLNEHYNKEKQL